MRRTRFLIKVIASSSAGNCYLIDDGVTAVVVECGIKYDEFIPAIKFRKISGVLVSHEHKDHSKISEKLLNFGYDVYCSSGTAEALNLQNRNLNIVKSKQLFKIGTLDIMPFDVQHDCNEPLGFLIKSNATGEKLLFATDTYLIKYKFSNVNYFLLECNYDIETLNRNIEKDLIPRALKNRILKSHLSLENLIDYLKKIDLSKAEKIYLIHISSGNLNLKKAVEEVQNLTFAEVKTFN